jgi:hypothetical protein
MFIIKLVKIVFKIIKILIYIKKYRTLNKNIRQIQWKWE